MTGECGFSRVCDAGEGARLGAREPFRLVCDDHLAGCLCELMDVVRAREPGMDTGDGGSYAAVRA